MASTYKYGAAILDTVRDTFLKARTVDDYQTIGMYVLQKLYASSDVVIDKDAAARQFAYVGFDALAIVGKLYQLALIKHRAAFVEEMMLCCMLYACRGTTVVKPTKLNRTSNEGVGIIKTLIDTYEIREKADSSSSTITLSRIACCFPHYVVRIYADGKGKVTGEIPDGYRWLCTPQAAAMLPPDWPNAKAVHLAYTQKFSAVIKQTWDADRAANYFRIMNEGCLFSTADRKSFFSKLGINSDIPSGTVTAWKADATAGNAKAMLLSADPLPAITGAPVTVPAASGGSVPAPTGTGASV